MYCYTKINHLMCIFNELILWTEISKEHPVFIKNILELSKKSLPSETQGKLDEISESFTMLQDKSKELKLKIKYSMKIQCAFLYTLKEYIDAFLHLDRLMLSHINEVAQLYKEDPLLQTLLQHMSEEHTYMYEVFQNIKEQLK